MNYSYKSILPRHEEDLTFRPAEILFYASVCEYRNKGKFRETILLLCGKRDLLGNFPKGMAVTAQ